MDRLASSLARVDPEPRSDVRTLRQGQHVIFEGELTGHELIQGFLVLVNDVRDYIQRLIRQQEDASVNSK